MNLVDFRQKYPQYDDMNDGELAISLHHKFYSDIPFSDFASKIEFTDIERAPFAPVEPELPTETWRAPVEVAPTLDSLYKQRKTLTETGEPESVAEIDKQIIDKMGEGLFKAEPKAIKPPEEVTADDMFIDYMLKDQKEPAGLPELKNGLQVRFRQQQKHLRLLSPLFHLSSLKAPLPNLPKHL